MNSSQVAREQVGKPNLGTIGCTIAINGILGYFFYIYAFANPDMSTCYVDPDTWQASTTGSGGAMNVSHVFHMWFLVGFILKCLGMVQAILGICSSAS